MENGERITVLDENGNEKEARVLNVVEIDGQEYLLYTVEENEEEENLYVNKIIKNENGEEDLAPIEMKKKDKAFLK